MKIPQEKKAFPGVGKFPRAFSLLELLVVMGLIATLSVISIPAAGALKAAGSVNQAIADVSRSLEMARAYAMANNTYVRVAIGQIPAQGGRVVPATVIATMFSASGGLGPDSDMGDSAKWPLLNHPVILDGFLAGDALNAASPSTSGDVTPSGDNVGGTKIGSLSRKLSAAGGSPVTFTAFVQLAPSGESRVAKDEPARHIKLAFDQPVSVGRNPFILRLSGANGSVAVLRKEDGIQ
ncbi:MAG: prepilin-type N-terminal cleavage/methylation domain-containing protein [Terrimicrobiaceae bacterium]